MEHRIGEVVLAVRLRVVPVRVDQFHRFTDPLRLRVLFTLDQLEVLQQVVAKLATNRVNRDTYMRGIVPRDWKRQQREKRN